MAVGMYTYEDNLMLRRFIRIAVYFAVIISLAWFIVYGFMGQTIVSGQSMAPVLNAGDTCLVNRLKYDLTDPDRYDIILFERTDTGKHNIKRVIGLPGETVQIRSGEIYVDGRLLDDERLGLVALPGIAENEVELGRDEYFVLGVNTESSEDSRFASIGNVKRAMIKGKVWFRIQPLSDIGIIE